VLHQEELRRVFDTFQALFASVHSLVDKRDFYDTYRPILGEPVDPTYGRSHLQPIPLTADPTYSADPTYGRSHLRPIPLTANPTYGRSHLRPIPLTADPTYGRSHLWPIPLTADPTSRKELQLV
jgi:hypothetical protein